MDKERIILPDPTDIALDRIAPMMAQMAEIQLSLATRLVAASTERHQSDADSLLTIEEAAARLKCSADWLYRHAKRLPFTVRMGRNLHRRSDSCRKEVHLNERIQGLYNRPVLHGGRMYGDGTLYRKPRSPFWHMQYYLRGRRFRETTKERDYERAPKGLPPRLKEVGADTIGAKN